MHSLTVKQQLVLCSESLTSRIRNASDGDQVCHVLNIGPNADVRCLLTQFEQSEGLVSIDHIETASVALDILDGLPESDLPDIVIIPFRLPILAGPDLIIAIRSRQKLQSIPIFVWGPDIPVDDIGKIYNVGAAGVFVGQFKAVHLDALRQFCYNRIGARSEDPVGRAFASASRPVGKKYNRNVRLGALFIGTGSVSAVFWTCALLQFGWPYIEDNISALPVYAALTSAGVSLIRLGRS